MYGYSVRLCYVVAIASLFEESSWNSRRCCCFMKVVDYVVISVMFLIISHPVIISPAGVYDPVVVICVVIDPVFLWL